MMRWLDNAAHEIGWFVIIAAIVAVYWFLCVLSPLLRWLTANLAMAAWALCTIGVGLFVAWRNVDDGKVGEAIACLFAGALLGVPWFFAAREFYPAYFPPKPGSLKIWD